MPPRSAPLGQVLLVVVLLGCSSGPMPAVPEDQQAVLDLAAGSLGEKPDHALYLLEESDSAAFTPEELERYKVLYAEALFRTGDAWGGFEVIRDFVEDHRFSAWTPQVEEVQFQIGAFLIQSESAYWIFGSDAEDGEIVLQEFVERFSTNSHVPDALRLLGGYSYQIGRWSDARRRYEQILREHPNSEWVALAAFRRVMSIHADLLGPEYDLPQMTRAREELRDYLASGPERPEFRDGAGAALAEVDDWVAKRHMIDAEFYRTVGNRYGERLHLQVLLQDSAGHPLAEDAEQRLAAMEEVR